MPEKQSSSEWLMSLVLNASQLVPNNEPGSGLVSMGVWGEYEIFGIKTEDTKNPSPLVQTSVFKFYVAKLPSGQLGLMKIATNSDNNEILENEVKTLIKLQRIAKTVDDQAVEKLETPSYYGAMFPIVVEKIDAGGRMAVFLGYHECINSYRQLRPLSLITATDRIDLKTGQWILGKALKLLYFIHTSGFCVGSVNASNILLETDLHGVLFLDFSHAQRDPISETMLSEVSKTAKIVWEAAGGSMEEDPPYDPEIMSKNNYEKYVSFLRGIINGRARSAEDEFFDLYEMADKIWPKVAKTNGSHGFKRQFHEFKTYPK